MRPGKNDSYRLVTNAAEYAICHKLLRERGDTDVEMSFPTVIARRAGKPIGFISTYPSDRAVTVGKLLVKDTPRPLIIAMRLAEAYENVLRMAGITGYQFPVSRRFPAMIATVRNSGICEKIHETHTDVWFRRKLNG